MGAQEASGVCGVAIRAEGTPFGLGEGRIARSMWVVALGTFFAGRFVGHTVLPKGRNLPVAREAEGRLFLKGVCLVTGAVGQVAGGAIETFHRTVFHLPAVHTGFDVGVTFQTQFARFLSHHERKVTGVRTMTIYTLSPGKGFVWGDFRGDAGESLVTPKAENSTCHGLLEQRRLSGPMGLVALAAFASSEGTVKAVLSHFVPGFLMAREAEPALLVGKQCPL
jgi:hypothetical protein